MDLMFKSKKHPHEVWWLVALVISGVSGTINFNSVASPTIRELHFPFGHIMYGGIAAWSLLALVGLYWKKESLRGIAIHQAGLMGLTLYGITYAVIIFGNSGWRAFGFALIIGGLSIANLVRVRQLQKDLKTSAAARTMLKEDE
jgi:hypothetical protein